MRLFVAVDTPPEVKDRLEHLCAELRESHAQVRWESRNKFHVTMKFLGAADDSLVQNVMAALERVSGGREPFSVTVRGIGTFPNLRNPRIVWVGVDDPTGGLVRLHVSIDQELVPLGFQPEDRAFHPHLTLGRIKGTRNLHTLRRMLESVTFEGQPTTVHEILLVRSELKPSGSVYTILKMFPFIGIPRRSE